MSKTPPIRWRREPRETGLARVTQGERGYQLWRGNQRLASVSVAYKSGRFSPKLGYYWAARCDEAGVPFYNSISGRTGVIYYTVDAAKRACAEYVRGHLNAAKRKTGGA
jgi:hypothetical protein